MSKLSETKPLQKKEIKLVEDGINSESNFENQPVVRTDVIRESDAQNKINIESGHLKGIKDVYIQGQERKIEKAPIIIDRSNAGIIENEPVRLEGVVREGDSSDNNFGPCGGAKQMREKWLTMGDDSNQSKKPFQMDIDPQGAIILESTPEVRSDVVRGDDVIDNVSTESGYSKKLADRFKNWGDDKPNVERKISIDQSQGCILENEPEQRTDVVKSGGPSGWEVDFEAGRTKNLKQNWISAAQEADAPKSKPLWQMELEAAKESGVYENEPEQNQGVIRECDVVQSTDVPVQTKNLKNLWLNKEADLEAELSARRSSQPQVRNKPKRVLHDFKPRTPTPDSADETRNNESIISNGNVENKSKKKSRKKSEALPVDKSSSEVEQGYILENEPEQHTDIVKSGGPTGWEVNFEEGRTKNIKQNWLSAAQECDTPKSKPLWQMELEAAKESCVYENEPEENDVPEFVAVVLPGSNKAKASLFGER